MGRPDIPVTCKLNNPSPSYDLNGKQPNFLNFSLLFDIEIIKPTVLIYQHAVTIELNAFFLQQRELHFAVHPARRLLPVALEPTDILYRRQRSALAAIKSAITQRYVPRCWRCSDGTALQARTGSSDTRPRPRGGTSSAPSRWRRTRRCAPRGSAGAECRRGSGIP